MVEPIRPRTFFLNERQELAGFERDGHGSAAKYAPVDWKARANTLASTFKRAVSVPAPRDPTLALHRYLLGVPATEVEKLTTRKDVPEGRFVEPTHFGGLQSLMFAKVGIDLVDTLAVDRRVVLHVASARVEPLQTALSDLTNATARERGRWINIEGFEPIPASLKVDAEWLSSLGPGEPTRTFVRFHPMLSRADAEALALAIAHELRGRGSRLQRRGRDFSGRFWCGGTLSREDIAAVADAFPSVQSLHPPLPITAAAGPRIAGKVPKGASRPLPPRSRDDMPIVAVVDAGVRRQHPQLGPYLVGHYRNPNLGPGADHIGGHGTKVASAVIFGSLPPALVDHPHVAAACRVMDVMVSRDDAGLDPAFIDHSVVQTAIDAAIGMHGDLRVFNLSFDTPPAALMSGVLRRELRQTLQDLDNLAFARDVVMVYAAGNSEQGVIPAAPYPHHVDDPAWQLGVLASSFNGLVCGSYVDPVGEDDVVVSECGAPSPFTRAGPGFCDAPVPGFSAPAGNTRRNYDPALATGVGVFSDEGAWEDHVGTSLAAPLVARQAALVLRELAMRCPGAPVFAATARAWMSLVARRPRLQSKPLQRLASRTLGQGHPTAERLRSPEARSAVFVWQTVLTAPSAVSRVQLPIPLAWLRSAQVPVLRLVASWLSPVNAALHESWACRRVHVKLRPFGAKDALRARGHARGAYPLIDREYDLRLSSVEEKGFTPADTDWTVECEYVEVGAYPPAMTVTDQQRVGMVFELSDRGESPRDVQPFIQALPQALALDRLSLLQQPLDVPVVLAR